MQYHMLKSKLHRVAVTEADLDYQGSLGVDRDLLAAAQMRANEMVKVYNINNGERFETYLIEGPAGSGQICLNGAAARKGQPGDRLILVTSCWLDETELAGHEPVVVLADKHNRIKAAEHKEQPHKSSV